MAWISRAGCIVCGVMLAASAQAADRITIGLITPLSGPAGIIGANVRDAARLALQHLGGKIGGLPATLIVEDDQQKPDLGVQLTDKLIRSDKADVIVAGTFSNITLALVGPAERAHTVIVSSVAGPSQLAGKDCSRFFFSTSWQGDNFAEAMGAWLQGAGKQNLFLMAPNYAAGHDVIAGFKRYYKGSVANEVFTPLEQLDFATELTQIRSLRPAGVFAFYPGGLGIQFVKQYAQSGLERTVPLYTAYTVDNATLPAMGKAAVGQVTATDWNAALANPANRRFVADFTAKYHYLPAEYAAQTYDAINLIDSGVRGVKGNVADTAAFVAALAKADFSSVRGRFRFNTNHFAIQNIYMEEVAVGTNGKPFLKLGEVAMRDHGDAYADQCKMR